MRFRNCIAILVLLLTLAAPLKSQNPPEPANPLHQLAWMIGGTWTANGDKGPDGKPFHVETKFNWAENHRGLVFVTWFLVDGKLLPIYQGFYAWHPGQKKFNFLYSDNEGALTSGTATWQTGTLEQEFQIVEPDGTAKNFRSTVKHTAPDRYDWNVRGKNSDGQWATMFALTYTRKQE